MPYESTHNFDITVKNGNTAEKNKILEGKNNKLCFDKKGTYTIIPESCYKFEKP